MSRPALQPIPYRIPHYREEKMKWEREEKMKWEREEKMKWEREGK